MNDARGVILLVLVVAVAIVAIWAGARAARQRREALGRVAAGLGWSFEPGETGPWSEHEAFDCFGKGHSRRAYNTMRGVMRVEGREFDGLAGDYSYKVTTSNGKTTTTTTYRFSYLIVRMPFATPSLLIRREGLLDKLAGAVGFDDIDFESEEFSRRFFVKSGDKRFAYDVVSQGMMEFLLSAPPPALSIAYGLCCISDGSGRWEPAEFAARVEWSGRFFGLWPKFLTDQLDAGRGTQGASA